jgi:hypothetical protein
MNNTAVHDWPIDWPYCIIFDALIMLKTGRIDDGITALEREFFPRYADAAECEVAYKRAMGIEGSTAA